MHYKLNPAYHIATMLCNTCKVNKTIISITRYELRRISEHISYRVIANLIIWKLHLLVDNLHTPERRVHQENGTATNPLWDEFSGNK